jgi:hypothetical protein
MTPSSYIKYDKDLFAAFTSIKCDCKKPGCLMCGKEISLDDEKEEKDSKHYFPFCDSCHNTSLGQKGGNIIISRGIIASYTDILKL